MKKYKYTEAELIQIFELIRLTGSNKMALLDIWLDAKPPIFNAAHAAIFDEITDKLAEKIPYWNEEDLKMKFISFVLRISYLVDNELFNTYFEKNIDANVRGTYLSSKSDFMIAKGILDMPQNPYFHFQEYKRQTDPNGNPMAQVLQAMLIAQSKNNNQKPIYGCTVVGKYWEFIVLHQKTYCVSQSYNCTKNDDLLQIIAILRKFKVILETELLD